MSGVQEIVVLSDLHMGAARTGLDAPDAFTDDEALASLLDHLTDRPAHGGVPLRLILLGDIVDFVFVGAGEAPFDRSAAAGRSDLDAIAAAHPVVFAALGRLAATAGIEVDIVPGNHDMELALPGVTEHLASLAAAAAGRPEARAALRGTPWMVHVPGVLHAEHGQQHHDLNRFADLSAVSTEWRDGLRHLPPAALLDALLATRMAGAGPGRLAGAVARGTPRLAASAWILARGRGRAPQAELDGGTLPPALLAELDRASAARSADVALRLARRALAAAARRSPAPALDLRPAAARTHAILARHGRRVPFVVFGHTHVPRDEPLGEGGRHLNAGTWSRIGPGAGERTVIRVVVEDEDGAPRAQLERWDAERQALVA